VTEIMVGVHTKCEVSVWKLQ